MTSEVQRKRRNEHVTEWVTGGSYAVAVDVEAIVFDDRPGECYFTPETVRLLEKLEALAEAGDAEALERAGTVYVRFGSPLLASDRISANGGASGASRL